MCKYFLYPLLISLFIYSCANQRNAKDTWDKKRITTACDCADMAKDVFTEIISDIRKNPGLSMDSIMNSKETVWKPRFERCDEIEKERRQSETSSFEEELEKCESAKELESLMDTLTRLVKPEVDWDIPESDSNKGICECLRAAINEDEAQKCDPDKTLEELAQILIYECLSDDEYVKGFTERLVELKDGNINNTNIELCECLVAANSEEEALQCAPDKTIDELMEILTSECLEMAEARYEEEYPVEEPTEEALEPLDESESKESAVNKKIEYEFNPDLAFQAQEIFSTLESEDFDLFLNLVKVDTVDFFYWRIPSADFNLNGLTNLSMEVEGGDDMMTVNALDYLNMFKGFDMNFIIQNQGDGRFPAAGIAGSCGLKDGITDCYEKCYKIMVFKQCSHEALLENYASIEKLIAGDPYILWDALISSCVHDSEIWMVFDESNEYKLIGIYDWYWTP
mgnify:CR=1 FL=1